MNRSVIDEISLPPSAACHRHAGSRSTFMRFSTLMRTGWSQLRGRETSFRLPLSWTGENHLTEVIDS